MTNPPNVLARYEASKQSEKPDTAKDVVTDEYPREVLDAACKAYNDQSMQLSDAQYVCMNAALKVAVPLLAKSEPGAVGMVMVPREWRAAIDAYLVAHTEFMNSGFDDHSTTRGMLRKREIQMIAVLTSIPAAPPVPAIDRVAESKRFPDKGFNDWLDDGISDAGHTVRDTITELADAWAAWSARDYYRAAPAQPQAEVPGWRPIETAPRDNTRILVYENGDAYIAWWTDSSLWRSDQRGLVRVYPRAWMPLPAPPRELAAAQARGEAKD